MVSYYLFLKFVWWDKGLNKQNSQHLPGLRVTLFLQRIPVMLKMVKFYFRYRLKTSYKKVV